MSTEIKQLTIRDKNFDSTLSNLLDRQTETSAEVDETVRGIIDQVRLGGDVLYKRMPADLKAALLTPYVSIERNEVRLSARVKDSLPNLRRNDLRHRSEDVCPMFRLGVSAQNLLS